MFQKSIGRLLLASLVSLTVACAAPPVKLDVVYSNFGADMAFDKDPIHGWGINGFLGPESGQQAIGQQFTPSGNYRFRDAQVAVVLLQGPNSIDIFLQKDSNGLPGAVIERISISGLKFTPTILTATSSLLPTLQDGTSYWLTLVAGAEGVVAGWSWNSMGDASDSTFAATQGGSPEGLTTGFFARRCAFQIDGTP